SGLPSSGSPSPWPPVPPTPTPAPSPGPSSSRASSAAPNPDPRKPTSADETQIISPVTVSRPAPAPGQWDQGMPVPAVQPPRNPPPAPPPEDVHQPTSVLGSVLPTQSIVPPK